MKIADWLTSLRRSTRPYPLTLKRSRPQRRPFASRAARPVEVLEDRVLLTISFDFNYAGAIGSGIGFEDASEGQARRDALEAVAATYGGFFDETGTIEVDVTSYSSPGSSTLASAGSSFFLAGDGDFSHQIAATKILTGIDLNGAASDANLSVNWGKSWELADDFQSGEFDFTATIMHEFSHMLGFNSLIAQDGTSQKNNATIGNPGEWAIYDSFLTDSTGASLIDPDTYILDSSWSTHSVGGTSPGSGLFFNGYNAMTANGGDLVGLYTPTTWNGGSSVSHLDTDNPAYTSLMMSHSTPPGLGPRSFDPIEIGIWRDMGFNMTGDGNAAPIANDDGGTGFSTDEDASFIIGDVLANDFDPDPHESETIYVSGVDTTSTAGTVNVVGTGMQTRFTSTGPFSVPSYGTETFDLVVSGLDGQIRDVNVNLNIEHDIDAELFISLISPNGTEIELISSRGGFEDNFTNTYLNDEALLSIDEPASSQAALAPFTSSFRPEEPLSAFAGELANGTWVLKIRDAYTSSPGTATLQNWSLDIIAQHIEYDPNGQFDYLGNGQQATDTFTYTLMDVNGSTETATATIVINGSGLPAAALPYSEDFNDDVADNLAFVGEERWGIFTDSGDKSLVFNGRSSYGLGVAYLDTEAPLPSQYEIVSKIASWSTPNVWYDGFLVFDYQGPEDFKYAGMFVGQNQWVIGHYEGNWGNRIAEFDMDDVGGDIKADREYVLLLEIDGDDVELFVDGIKRVSTTFVDGIHNGTAGVATYNGWTAFDDLEIGTSVSYGKPVENPFFDDFDDGVADQMYFNHPNYWKPVSPGDKSLLRVNTSYTDLLAVAHVPLDPELGLYDFTVSADVRSLEPNVGLNNAFLVFDYRHDNDFKYAGFLEDENKWVIGHYQGDFNNRAAELEASVANVPINVRQWYELEVLIVGDYVELSADGVSLINTSFGDGYLSQGAVGLASDRSFTWFDNFAISEDGITTPPATEPLFANWDEEIDELLI